VSGNAGLVLAPEARLYDHGSIHPLRPERVLLTWELIEAYGLNRSPTVTTLSAEPADEETLLLVHTPAYIEATRSAGHGGKGPWGRFGFGPGDNPIFTDMHEAAAIVTGATLAAAGAVLSGRVVHAFNAAGGLHHAMPARASGFCVYDDPAVAIAWMLESGVERIAYVDVDVHHGDGPQAIFYDDPRVLTISIHEYAPHLGFFPGSGAADESGVDGSAVNVPMSPGTGDDAWFEAFQAVVPSAVTNFSPDVLVTQLGCDTHASDPLAHLRLTTTTYRRVATVLHELAHSSAHGRWVATGGGGYQWARVVPRAWTIAFAEMAEVQLPDRLPESWIESAASLLGAPVPTSLSEPALEDVS
jgi:acetoin utilization protein AcuC